jgi:type III secretion protein C
MKKYFILISIICMMFSITSYAANTPPWPTEETMASNPNPFYYYFTNDTLKTAMIKVAQSFDVRVHFSDDLVEETLNQKISGRFKVTSPVELFNKLSNMYAFTWFYYSGVLYIAPNIYTAKNFYVAADLISNFKNILINDGLLDNRFGWSEVPSQGMIVVSGPKDYVGLIEKKMKTLHIAPVDQQFAVYHLKYASAADTNIELNNSKIVIPGVATILRTMLNPNQNSDNTANNQILKQVIEPLKNNLKTVMPNSNLAGDGLAQSLLDSNKSDSPTQKGSVSSAVIQADERLNTIIIRDKSNNIPVYKALIDLLDVPAPLIQVQVLILDIDQVKMNDAGINWWGNAGNGFTGGFGTNELSSGTQSGAATLTASFGNVNPGNLIVNNVKGFMAGLHFLENKGFAKAQSKSAVVTIDNIAAVVNLTESFYTITSQNSQSSTTPISTQMQMQVTPHIIYDSANKVRIKLTVGLQDGNVEERTVNGLPATLQGQLNSQALVEEGSSLLLAGFTHKQTEQVENKVPILGDIPILGWLFKDKTSSNREYQRLYLVTPKVIWSDRNNLVPNYSILNEGTPEEEQPKSTDKVQKPLLQNEK